MMNAFIDSDLVLYIPVLISSVHSLLVCLARVKLKTTTGLHICTDELITNLSIHPQPHYLELSLCASAGNKEKP